MKHIGRLLILLFCTGSVSTGFAETSTKAEIQYLLSYVDQSACVFIRNGKEHDSHSARLHIEKKYNYFKARIDSAEDFIEHAASKSSFSGRPYKIQCGDQTRMVKQWLIESLNAYRSSNKT